MVSRAHSTQSSFVLSENRAEKLGGFKRVLRELYVRNNWRRAVELLENNAQVCIIF